MNLLEDKSIKPMLLKEFKEPFNDKEYLYEIKFDGIRALIFVSKDEIIIKSRNGKILNDYFPELLNIKDNITKKCIFDGEIIVMEDNKPSFKKVQERLLIKNKRKIDYHIANNPSSFICFDILYENKNLTDLSLIKRKEILNKYKDTNIFIKSRVYDEGIKLFEIIKQSNLEGIVAKKKNSKYEINKRSINWLKIKNVKEDIFYICGYKEKNNIVSILLCDKNYIYIGKIIIGKNSNEFNLIKKCKKINNRLKDFSDKSYTYIDFLYKCEVEYLEKTRNNHLRHPILKKIIKSTKKG